MSSSTLKKPKKSLDDGSKLLDKVLEVINTPVRKFKGGEKVSSAGSAGSRGSASANTAPRQVTFEKEAKLLYQFWLKYKNERLFSSHIHVLKFLQVFRDLIKLRLCNSLWKEQATAENILRLFQCLRIFMRDQNFQNELHDCNGLPIIAENLKEFSEKHLNYGNDENSNDTLKEIANICQKLSAEVHQRNLVVENKIHESLVLLLSSNDVFILHLSLYALIGLTKSEEPKLAISDLNCTEILLQIVGEYDNTSKQLAVTLLRQLSTLDIIREQIKVFHGIPVLLSLLRNDSLKLLWNVVWILVQLSEDHDTSNEIRLLGGIPLLISLLQDGQYYPEDTDSTSNMLNDITMEQKHSLKSAVCAALTELILNDTNARFVVQANGIYLICMLVFPTSSNEEISQAEIQLQKNAFRSLRFLFSMERNRQLFKRLFPADLFEVFIDVGHYQKDLEAYDRLVNIFNELNEDELIEMQQRVHTANQNKAPSSFIQQYAVYEHLGSGAFGSVYKVKKKGGQTFLAMKEISTHRLEFGKSMKEKTDCVNSLINECSFVKKQLNHTNIVKYHKSFLDGDKLYIIMDLIDGAPLGEHFSSLKEKGQKFTEERLWGIFIQMVLALRYIHKEKFIVHRDLSPNNIMLDENDKVTITDFGLARQKNPDASKLTSMVGTILYSCPEVVGGLPYGDKADIWAIGCILYQMATLEPPFYSGNMLTLAKKIVEAEYVALTDDFYTLKVSLVIQRCLTAKAEERPDILEVASLIPEILIFHMESLRTTYFNLERKLDKERKKVQKQSDHMKNYPHHNYLRSNTEDYLSNNELSISTDDLTRSKNNSQDDLLIPPLVSNKTYEESLINGVDGVSLQRNNGDKIERHKTILNQNSSSGSWDSNDEETFKKPKNLFQVSKKKLLPIENPSVTKISEPIMINHELEREIMKRTQSCSYLDNMKSNVANTPPSSKFRPISAQATISISPRKVREINDPVLQMLSQLHKVVYVSQLPPSLKFDPNRRIIDQFKRSLFSTPSSPMNLKNELKKLVENSKEQVDIPHLHQFDSNASFRSSISNFSDHLSFGVSYEDLQSVIENTLMETGYYNISATNRTKPLGPITSSSARRQSKLNGR